MKTHGMTLSRDTAGGLPGRGRTALGAGVLALSVLGGLLGGAAAGAQARPDFSGSWRLNEKESDNPRAKMAENRRRGGRGGFPGGGGMGGPGGGMHGGGMRGPGGRGPGGRGPGDDSDVGMGEPGTRAPGRFERLEEHYRTLQIRHDEPALAVEYGDERGETFYTDGRRIKRDTGERELVEVRARWKDRRVVVERATRRGKLNETFALSPDGTRLVLVSRTQGPMGSMTLRRVYERDTRPEAAPAEPGG